MNIDLSYLSDGQLRAFQIAIVNEFLHREDGGEEKVEGEESDGEPQFTLESNLVVVTVPSYYSTISMIKIISNMGAFGSIRSVKYDPDNKTLLIAYADPQDAKEAVRTISLYGYEEYK